MILTLPFQIILFLRHRSYQMIQARKRGSLLKALFSVVLLTHNNLLLLIQFILISRLIFPLTERVRFAVEIC